MTARIFFLGGLTALFLAGPAAALELIMVERKGCHYCIAWKEDIGPAYPKTEMGRFAPLRMVDIAAAPPEGVTFDSRVVFTPTFVLVDDGEEIGRIEGHPGEEFFWGVLHRVLTEKAGYTGPG
jgi:thioredoxin-related protein